RVRGVPSAWRRVVASYRAVTASAPSAITVPSARATAPAANRFPTPSKSPASMSLAYWYISASTGWRVTLGTVPLAIVAPGGHAAAVGRNLTPAVERGGGMTEDPRPDQDVVAHQKAGRGGPLLARHVT